MAEEHDVADDVRALLAAAGVEAAGADLAGARALYRRFAAGRERLATLDLEEAEPLTIVVPEAAAREAS